MILTLITELRELANVPSLTLTQRNAVLTAIRLLETMVSS